MVAKPKKQQSKSKAALDFAKMANGCADTKSKVDLTKLGKKAFSLSQKHSREEFSTHPSQKGRVTQIVKKAKKKSRAKKCP